MELVIATRSILDEQGNSRRFCYRLLVDQVERDTFFCENYGVGISDDSGSEATVRNITSSAYRIDELLSLLVENQVGPAALPDIVADWL